MQPHISIRGDKEVARAFRQLGDQAPQTLTRALRMGALVVQRAAKEKLQVLFYSAGRPWKKTGTLKRSVNIEVSGAGAGSYARIGSNLLYARVQEEGATIVPKKGKMLYWRDASGNWYCARKVRIPARPWLVPAFMESSQEIIMAFDMVTREAIREAGL